MLIHISFYKLYFFFRSQHDTQEPQCSEPKRKIRRLITFDDGSTNIHNNCSQLNFEEAIKVFGSSKSWIMSATNFNDYLNVMFAIKTEFKKDTNTLHVNDKKLPNEPCWLYQQEKCEIEKKHKDPQRINKVVFHCCWFCVRILGEFKKHEGIHCPIINGYCKHKRVYNCRECGFRRRCFETTGHPTYQ